MICDKCGIKKNCKLWNSDYAEEIDEDEAIEMITKCEDDYYDWQLKEGESKQEK